MLEEKKMVDNNYAFVDLQGFKSNTDRFIVKEVAIITKNTTFHDIVKTTPLPFSSLDVTHKKQVKWLTYNFHGLKWCWGSITFQELRKTIDPILAGKTVYVKGKKKIKWLEQILGLKWGICKIIDMETFNCALSLSVNNGCTYQKFQVCALHKAMQNQERCHCALKNVYILENWFQQNQEAVQSELSQIQDTQ